VDAMGGLWIQGGCIKILALSYGLWDGAVIYFIPLSRRILEFRSTTALCSLLLYSSCYSLSFSEPISIENPFFMIKISEFNVTLRIMKHL
jgi:hypothetical protein